MKKNFVRSIKNARVFLVVIFVFITFNLEAQPLPHMYVDRSIGKERRDCFMAGKNASGNFSKYKLLSANLPSNEHETDSIVCPIDGFKNFTDTLDNNITFLRFYIAAYNQDSGGVVPAHLNKHLTLIIAPATGNCDSTATDRGDYYNIYDRNQIKLLPESVKNGWINYYNDKKVAAIVNTIHSHPDNEDANPNYHHYRKYTDTKYIVYYRPYFAEFLDSEIKYQANLGINIKGIQIDFCSHTQKGIKLKDNAYHYKDRIILQFEYLTQSEPDKKYHKYFIDTTERNKQMNVDDCKMLISIATITFPNQIAPQKAYLKHPGTLRKPLKILTVDNGTLCPANCPN
jgi:hypothetical protein